MASTAPAYWSIPTESTLPAGGSLWIITTSTVAASPATRSSNDSCETPRSTASTASSSSASIAPSVEAASG